jgi:hypothetical protein
MTDQASIDTRIYGNPDDIREAANKLYTVYESLDTLSGQFKSKLRTNFYAWDGEAAHSYDDAAVSMGAKVQRLTDRFYSAYAALRAYAQQLDYHYRDMESIREQAKVANLAIVNKYDILPPDPIPEPTIGKCYPESAYGTPPSIGVQVGSPDGKFSHDRQVEIFHELDQQVQAVRDDLEQWVVTHVRSVQEECALLIFARKVGSGMLKYARDPWQILPDATTTSWDISTNLYASLVDTLAASEMIEPSTAKPLPAAITEASVARLASASDDSVARMRGIGSTLSKAATAIGVAHLGYDVVTSDTPAQTAITGSASLAVGTIAGAVVSDTVEGALYGAIGGPESAAVGAGLGAIAGVTAGIITAAGGDTLYEEIPLEYRERADAFVAHLPYYMFGAAW